MDDDGWWMMYDDNDDGDDDDDLYFPRSPLEPIKKTTRNTMQHGCQQISLGPSICNNLHPSDGTKDFKKTNILAKVLGQLNILALQT